MTPDPKPLSAEEKIERIRLANSGVVQDIDWLCDMAARTAKAERDRAHVEAERNAYFKRLMDAGLISLAEMNA